MKRFLLSLSLATVACAQGLAPLPVTPPGPAPVIAPLVIRFLQVGQGDAVLVTTPDGQTLLYDGGPSEARMRELIRQLGLTKLDVALASHADTDHSTGLIPAVGLLRPRFLINNGLAGDTETWARLTNVAAQAGVPGVKVANQMLRLGAVTM